jgi:MoxR-like ATPase
VKNFVDQAGHSYAPSRFASVYDSVADAVEGALFGKREAVRAALACLFAGGHLLVEDVPGVGKTTLARALASAVDGRWNRIQFTPDLLPSDITGISIWNQQIQRFEFHPGAVFANLVVADEINRASPKTQSALLEVMEERQVTVDAVGHPVPEPFMVIATQNPVDLTGTYRLPEAQLDRFLLRLELGYPDLAAEVELLENDFGQGQRAVPQVTDLEEVFHMIRMVASVHASPAVCGYIAALVRATRARQEVRLGVSPRGSQALLRVAKASAAADGRSYVVPDDVKAFAMAVLAHRLVLAPEAEAAGRRPRNVVDEVLATTAVPAGAV